MQTINEKSIRFEALQQLREIQANMVGVSFLPVIGIMKENNPYIKDIIAFQDELDDLTVKVQQFISAAKNGIDYSDPEEGTGEVDKEEKPEDDKEDKVLDSTEDDEKSDKDDKEEKPEKKEVEDSSESKE